MWGSARNPNKIDIDNEQVKSISTELSVVPIQSNVAPLVSFDKHGDIPCTIINSQVNSSQDRSICFCCSWKRSRKELCQVSMQFIISQFGLIILVSTYIILGGLLFYCIESRYEPHRNQQLKIKHFDGIKNIRHIVTEEFNWMLNISFELRYALWRGMLSRLDGYDHTGWRVQVSSERFDRLIENELARMQAEREKLMDKHDTRTDAAYNQKWTYSSAMLYSATVITTVGYGNIAPKSILGRMITCLYAIIGIPIMIMFLTNTGDLLAFCFMKYYSVIKNFIQRRRKAKVSEDQIDDVTAQHQVPIIVGISVVSLYIFAGAILFSHWEGWSYIDSAYFSFITFTTIGLGDLVPGKGTLTDNKNGKSILCALYLLFGLVLTTMCFRLIQDDLFAIKQRILARLGFRTYRHHRHLVYHIRQNQVHLRENNT